MSGPDSCGHFLPITPPPHPHTHHYFLLLQALPVLTDINAYITVYLKYFNIEISTITNT